MAGTGTTSKYVPVLDPHEVVTVTMPSLAPAGTEHVMRASFHEEMMAV
jgi:hypothetical protein